MSSNVASLPFSDMSVSLLRPLLCARLPARMARGTARCRYQCPRATPSTRSPQANVGFLGGLFGFVGLLGIRAYLAFGPAFGRFGALLCGAVVTHGCSVVNAGIAAGDGSGVRHASNYLGLVARYVTLVVANAWRTRGPLRIISLLCVVGAAWTASAAARKEHGDDCPLAQ